MPSRDDLSTRASIRNAAMTLFAERGFDAVSVRHIATAAGVSPGLVIHHFGSKAGLQAAVVEHMQAWFDQMLAISEGTTAERALESRSWAEVLGEAASAFGSQDLVPDLINHLVADRDPAASHLFAQLVERSQQVMDRYVQAGVIVDDPDPQVRTAMLVAADMGALLLRRQIVETVGFDPYSPDGMQRWAEVATRVYAATFAAPVSVDQED